ncbi:MAG: TlpA family protein disulfide reductase [Bacteroidales bacterium]|nr:TlpA family protein disulfide reductase [Bacteroidales bacterium]HOY38319.1 TlpA disulfide reductase family protein [Bacteroidales bacterium]HQP05133.1 TlpA disulfide reductase family protein [Bacteroidales bacterium]
MKKLFFVFVLVVMAGYIFGQEVPQFQIKDINNKTVNTKDIIKNNGKPVVISFWATWCKPCIKELNAYNENYADWQKETGVKIIAISIDDSRSMSKVAPFVNGRMWEFNVYCDPNSDFKRGMNVNEVPHTFVLDKNGKVVWQHKAYVEGDENTLHEVIQKVAAGKPLK